MGERLVERPGEGLAGNSASRRTFQKATLLLLESYMMFRNSSEISPQSYNGLASSKISQYRRPCLSFSSP